MPQLRITLDSAGLRKRVEWLARAFRPLAFDRTLRGDIGRGLYQGGKGIGLSSGGTQAGDPDMWSFTTFVERIQGRFIEVWLPDNARADSYTCAGMSLKLFEQHRPFDEPHDIIAVHAELHLDGKEDLAKFKRGPHLHVESSYDPMPRCHFPLNLANLNHVVTSIKGLNAALKDFVRVLQHDLLPRYQKFLNSDPAWKN